MPSFMHYIQREEEPIFNYWLNIIIQIISNTLAKDKVFCCIVVVVYKFGPFTKEAQSFILLPLMFRFMLRVVPLGTFWVDAWTVNTFTSFKRLMLDFFWFFGLKLNKFLSSFHFTFFVTNSLFGQSFSLKGHLSLFDGTIFNYLHKLI